MAVGGGIGAHVARDQHLDRREASGTGNGPERKRAADMTDDERAAAKAERRNVIESNKAWKAATTVRRDWLTHTFAHRKTAPAGAEAYLAQVVTEGWGHERATSDALTLAGFPARENADPWTATAEQRQAITDALATATPKRALQIGLAVAVAMWETRTHPNTWRASDEQTVLTLTRLQEWGYPISDVEQRILTATDDPADQD
jgi:ParB family transcriptional regulator, chromosome partitioning protein